MQERILYTVLEFVLYADVFDTKVLDKLDRLLSKLEKKTVHKVFTIKYIEFYNFKVMLEKACKTKKSEDVFKAMYYFVENDLYDFVKKHMPKLFLDTKKHINSIKQLLGV